MIATFEAQLSRGVEAGLFRREVRARDLYIASCALGYFYLSNRYTLSAFLGVELVQSAVLHEWHHAAEDLLLRYVRATP